MFKEWKMLQTYKSEAFFVVPSNLKRYSIDDIFT